MNTTMRIDGDADIRRAALGGLYAGEKKLPCTLLYDDAGAALFAKICDTPEYYLTRTEIGILRDNVDGISAAIGERARLLELGSGEGVKTRILLRDLDAIEYLPVDISRRQLLATAKSIARDFPRLWVRPICADYSKRLPLPPVTPGTTRTAIFFPGSSIGNFEPEAAAKFLDALAHCAGRNGGLLIGVDLHKDRERINAAYNDSGGITARFNLNILEVLNRCAGADFNLAQFRHEASYNEALHRLEMRLISKCVQQVRFPSPDGGAETVVEFTTGESILTEHSYKYSLAGFAALVNRAGWTVSRTWTDADALFAVHWCVRRH